MKMFILKFCFIATLIFLSGCVGTIQDANPKKTLGQSSTDKSVTNYAGILSVKAISNDKVEVYFPVGEGDTDDLAYVIRYDGQQIPKYIYGSSMRPDYKGQLRAVIGDLEISTNYVFTVQLRNVKTGVESNNSASKSVKTFSNLTSNFSGITELRHLAGAAGTTGIQVNWNPAEERGTSINRNEIDPIEYKITVIDGSVLTPGSMNDSNFDEPYRKIVSAAGNKRSLIVNGLLSDRKYFVQVRAVHYGQSQYGSDPSYKVEENTKYLEITTYSDDIANLEFDNSKFIMSYPEGAGGLYSLKASWSSPVGNFDHIRIYYAVNGSANILNHLNTSNIDVSCSGAESIAPNIYCLYADYSTISKLISGLQPYIEYDVALAICGSVDCILSKRLVSELRTIKTTPPVATFGGIKSIDQASNINELDRMKLNFDLPNFLTGNISGYVVKYFGNDPTGIGVSISDFTNTTGLSVGIYDVRTSTSLEIIGIDPTSTEQYCFKMVPYVTNLDGSTTLGEESGLNVVCKEPGVKTPTLAEFAGIDTYFCDTLNRKIQITWNQPSSGVYSNFELYFQNTLSDFNFGQATDYSSSVYTRILIDQYRTSHTLTGLQPGTTYRFGMLSYYLSTNGPVRSEYNSSFYSCSF